MAREHQRVRMAALTGLGQLVGLLGSALIGVLVAGTLPPSPRVDGFFGANQIYALSLFLGQAVRITAPALLVRHGVAVSALTRAGAALTLASVATMLGMAIIGAGLVASAARASFTADLLLLAPAAGIHVACGTVAARLAVAGSFGYASAAYAAGSIVAGIAGLYPIVARGATALAPALLLGAVSVGAIMTAGYLRVLRGGARAPALAPHPAHGANFALRRIGLGAVPQLALQVLIASVTVAAGHVITGGTALLSYAFLALFAFTTIAITPMSIVLGPEMAERWDGAAVTLESIVRQATRLSVVISVPLIALGFLVGRPLAGELLGAALTPAELDTVFGLVGILAPTLLLTAAATAATVGVTTADRLGQLAAGLIGVCALAVIAGVVIATAGLSLQLTALISSVFILAFAGVTLWVALGSLAVPALAGLLAENVPVIAPAALLTLVLRGAVGDSVLAGCGAALLVLAVHFVVVLQTRRDVLVLVVGAVRARAAA